MAKLPIKGKGPSPLRSVGKEIGEAISKMIDDFGSIFTQKPGGKVKKITKPQDAIKEIQGGAKIVPQGPVTGGRTQGQRIPDVIQAMPGAAGGAARTISRGKTPIGELVKSGQRAKPKGMGDRKAVVPRPKPPAKRSQTVPVPTPKPRVPVPTSKPRVPVPTPKPKPPARTGGGGSGRPPSTTPPRPGQRPPQRPPRERVRPNRGEQAGAAARQAAILDKILKNIEEGGRGIEESQAGPIPKPMPKPKKPARTPNTKKIDPKGRPKKTPDTKKIDPKGRPVSAGKNVGFGPKGNIFPSNAEERKALMKMYGGTGSAAAKRALKGLQGDIVGGKAAYDAAKRKRLATNKKAGGKLGKDFMSKPTTRARSKIYKAPKSPMTNAKPRIKTYKPKKTPGMTGKPASRIYKKPKDMKLFNKGGKVARQVKGFGAARRPKN